MLPTRFKIHFTNYIREWWKLKIYRIPTPEIRDRVSTSRTDKSEWKSHLKITVVGLRYLRWCELQSRIVVVYIHRSLTIKKKKVILNQLFEEAKWESGLRVSNYFQYAVYLEPLPACIENSIFCLSFFLFVSSSRLFSRPAALSFCLGRTPFWPRAEKDVWYGHYLPENKLHSMLRSEIPTQIARPNNNEKSEKYYMYHVYKQHTSLRGIITEKINKAKGCEGQTNQKK